MIRDFLEGAIPNIKERMRRRKSRESEPGKCKNFYKGDYRFLFNPCALSGLMDDDNMEEEEKGAEGGEKDDHLQNFLSRNHALDSDTIPDSVTSKLSPNVVIPDIKAHLSRLQKKTPPKSRKRLVPLEDDEERELATVIEEEPEAETEMPETEKDTSEKERETERKSPEREKQEEAQNVDDDVEEKEENYASSEEKGNEEKKNKEKKTLQDEEEDKTGEEDKNSFDKSKVADEENQEEGDKEETSKSNVEEENAVAEETNARAEFEEPRPATPTTTKKTQRGKKNLLRAISTPNKNETMLEKNVTFLEKSHEISAIPVLSPPTPKSKKKPKDVPKEGDKNADDISFK